MIRLLLVAFGGWMAWRYRNRIREFASRLPEINEGRHDITKSLQNAPDIPPSGQRDRDGRS